MLHSLPFQCRCFRRLIQGQWAGHLYCNRESFLGLIQLAIESKKENGTFTGRAVTWKFTMDVLCKVEEDGTVHIRGAHDDDWFINLTGQLDAENGVRSKAGFRYPGDEQYTTWREAARKTMRRVFTGQTRPWKSRRIKIRLPSICPG